MIYDQRLIIPKYGPSGVQPSILGTSGMDRVPRIVESDEVSLSKIYFEITSSDAPVGNCDRDVERCEVSCLNPADWNCVDRDGKEEYGDAWT